MDLSTVWFILIAILFAGFFFLEGFDYGVGILLPFLGRTDRDRRVIINTIGPFWDANEVWMLTAGGAIFAAFPQWYATMFSGFYIALFLLLIALIVRAVGFEFRSKLEDHRWRSVWDWGIFFGSAIPALLWGVVVGNLINGLKIDPSMTYIGTFWDLLNPISLWTGVLTVALFTHHGALFIALRTTGEIAERASQTAKSVWIPALVIFLAFAVWAAFSTDLIDNAGIWPIITGLLSFICFLTSGVITKRDRTGLAFVFMGLSILLLVVTVFVGLYPRVMISNLDPSYSLTVENASSSPYTLKIMSIVALIMVPLVLLYQGWTYYVFRRRLTQESLLEY